MEKTTTSTSFVYAGFVPCASLHLRCAPPAPCAVGPVFNDSEGYNVFNGKPRQSTFWMNILCVKVFSFGKVGSRIACNINPWYCFTNTCALWIISIRTYSCMHYHSIYIFYSIYDMRLKVCVCGGGGAIVLATIHPFRLFRTLMSDVEVTL